ncbi:MAG: hypothetical protein IPG73_07345 [Ignavibacteria bacterium]|nr:hypothetical protein [Ignavibacteria bacterium]
MMVDDSIVGRQWFSDSVMTATTPVVAMDGTIRTRSSSVNIRMVRSCGTATIP